MRVLTGSVWEISASLPKDAAKGRTYRENHTFSIVSDTALGAMQVLFELHPDADVHSLQHRGARRTVLVDYAARLEES